MNGMKGLIGWTGWAAAALLALLCSAPALCQTPATADGVPSAPGRSAQSAAKPVGAASPAQNPQATAQPEAGGNSAQNPQATAQTPGVSQSPQAAAQTTEAPVTGATVTGATVTGATVTGVILDKRGNPIHAATVTLIPYGKLNERTTTSAADGSYTFTGLTPDRYRITVAAVGFNLYSSTEFAVRLGSSVKLPAIVPILATSTTVNVIASQDQIAVAQVHEQEQQRVLGVFPNFYTSYIWDAAPMPASQKYKLALRALVDPFQFVIVGATAGAEQYENVYPGYGQGLPGYGKRFGANLATSVTSRLVGSAILPSLFHQDPRYFYQGSGSVRSRTLHALSFVFVCRGDNRKNQLCYSHLLGSLTAAAVANAYLPASSRGVGGTFQTFGITLAGNAVGNLCREFLLRKLESIPRFANGMH